MALKTTNEMARPRSRVPKAKSEGEETLWLHCSAHGLEPLREYMFHATRKWRFDFAFPEWKLGIEVEGGIWSRGRHTRGSGYEEDARKYNAAAIDGWKVMRFSSGMVKSGEAINEILIAIGEHGAMKDKSKCKFDWMDYVFSPLQTHTQLQCPDCGYWTVWEDKKTGRRSSQCDGREAFMRSFRGEKP